ncbi:hypothetical protein, partial [Erwinia amylovora]|uniref:hypothetical protein n=1 Tax=Erwinia amylovora TaxID=552 RepID=UPI003D7020D8
FSGETATLAFNSTDMNKIKVTERLDTHIHGRDYHQKIGKIGLEIGMEYSYREAMAYEMAQLKMDIPSKSYYEFHIPQSCLFTYNGDAKTQHIMEKNVYQN